MGPEMQPESTEDGDPVIAEMDLLFSRPKDNADLHVLQYPLRHAAKGIGTERQVTAINLRPRYGRVEVKLEVLPKINRDDTDSFGPSACPSFDDLQPSVEEKQIGSEQILRSRSTLAAPVCNHAIAMYRPASSNSTPAFMLVPVKTVSQLRPAFDYIDKRDVAILRQNAEDKTLRANARGEGNPQKPGTDEEETVDVGFRRRETERAAERRRNSHASLRKQEETEAWLQMQFYPADSESSSSKRNTLFSGTATSTSTIPKPAERKPYISLYLDHTRADRLTEAMPTGETEPKSMRSLERLPTNVAVEQVITQARIATFADIVRLIGGNRTVKEVTAATRVVAMSVRGCWVAKKGMKEVGGERTNARDRYEATRALIIDMFRRTRVVTMMDAQTAVGFPILVRESTIKSILHEVAFEKRNRGWEIRLDDDDHFRRKNEQLCRTQDADWERRVAAARDTLAKSFRDNRRRGTMP